MTIQVQRHEFTQAEATELYKKLGDLEYRHSLVVGKSNRRLAAIKQLQHCIAEQKALIARLSGERP